MLKQGVLYSILGILLCSSCVNNMEEVRELNDANSTKIEIAHHIETHYYSETGLLQGIMTAPVLYRYMSDTPYIKLPDGLKVKFYNDSLQLQSILTAKEGIYYEKTNDITVKDSVVVTTRDGKMIETEILHWDPRKQQFYTNKPVKLTTPSQVIFGQNGLVAPPDLSWYQFNKASGDIRVDSSFTGGQSE